MSKIFSLLSKKKLQFLFLFYILLILPLLSPIAQNITRGDVFVILLVNCLIFISIAILSAFFSAKFEKIAYSILLIVSLVPSAIFLSYLLFANVLLQQNSVISLFETNPEESKEFIAYYLSPWIIIGALVYTLIPVVMIWKMKRVTPLKIKANKLAFTLSISCIILLVSMSQLSKSICFIDFYKTFASYKVRLAHEEKRINERQMLPYSVTISSADTIPQTLVLVIGESLTRHHMSLYGYQRNTNPLLSKVGENLFVYKDVVSPQVHTIPVIRSVLTLSDEENPDFFTEKPSLFELFNRAGFETYFISNQSFGGQNKTSYDVLLNLAQHPTNLSTQKKHDEIVLGDLKNILAEKQDKNRLIVIHLIGNHMAYEFRYPKQFNLFNHTKDNAVADAKYRNTLAKNIIDKYDNSVAYNDYIIDSVIKSLAKEPKASMIYFSDHGEEIYNMREFAGHAYEKISSYMCEIPFMVWVSDKSQYDSLVFDVNRPYSTGDVMYSISSIAGLKYEDYDSTKSVFSKDFKVKNRLVGEYSYEDKIRQ